MEPSPKTPEELLDEAVQYSKKKDDVNFWKYMAYASGKMLVLPESESKQALVSRYRALLGGH